ncbi:MAG: hypothetical protein OSJ69_12940 [Acetatifactor sp.]|nr:hypothetical protein [Acetatifactor sp.]
MTGKRKYLIFFVILWVLQMAAAFWFCTKKQGFHEDEYYTYYSTSRTNGFYVEDGKWMDRDAYRDEFVVLPGQRFQYGLVRQVQSWDVHPPMYYWVFHTVASLSPDVFSKWIGLSVNLFFHGINLILLSYLSYLVSEGDGKLAFWASFVYGFSPAAMSGVVFIRMYEMLTVFVLLCAVLHMRAYRSLKNKETEAGKLSVLRELFPMAAVTYIGFLTQYYYFIFLFFLAAAFCVWLLWRDRNIWNCLRYGVFQAAAFVLAYLTYPAFPGQMFRGQRGAQATESFFDLSNTFDRLSFFGDLMNRFVFGGLLGVTLPALAAGAVYLQKAGEKSGKKQRGVGKVTGAGGYGMLLAALVGYFAAVSKTALLLGDTSVRYQLPVYGIAVLLVSAAVGALCKAASGLPWWRRMPSEATGWITMICCIAVIAAGYRKSDVAFLYPEDAAQAAFAKEQEGSGALAVYLYNPGEEWCIWDVTNELLCYPAVYFAGTDSAEKIADERIAGAGTLVVYLAKGADTEEQLARFFQKSGESVHNGIQLIFEEKYCDVYRLLR